MKDKTAEELRKEIIIALRDSGFKDYISLIEIYTQKVYEEAIKQEQAA